MAMADDNVHKQDESGGSMQITCSSNKKKKKKRVRALCSFSLETYDHVLSRAATGKLNLCSVSDLQSEQIASNFCLLTDLYQTRRFSSLIAGRDASITAVALENSEVEKDLTALKWLDGTSNVIVSPTSTAVNLPPEGTNNLGDTQTDCYRPEVKKDSGSCLDGTTARANAVSPTGILAVKPITAHKDTMLGGFPADDCYRPVLIDTAMEMELMDYYQDPFYDEPVISSSVVNLPCNGPVSFSDQGQFFPLQASINLDSPISETEEHLAQPWPVTGVHDSASEEISEAMAEFKSEENIGLIEKYAMEALQLDFPHEYPPAEGDLPNFQILHETSVQESSHLSSVVSFAVLEEDQSSNSFQVGSGQNSPLSVLPLQQVYSAGANSVSFLGLMAQVSTGDFEMQHSCNIEDSITPSSVKSWKKRLVVENEEEEGEGATAPESKRQQLIHSASVNNEAGLIDDRVLH